MVGILQMSVEGREGGREGRTEGRREGGTDEQRSKLLPLGGRKELYLME
jgi:hypothetical protein